MTDARHPKRHPKRDALRPSAFVLAASTLLAGLVGFSCTAVAQSWDLEGMNRAIEQTNMIVGRGCAGTLISLKKQLILTNYHCIDDNISSFETEKTNPDGTVKKIRLRRYIDVPLSQRRYDGYTMVGSSSYVSEIVAEHKQRDLAVLHVKGAIPHSYASPLLPDGSTITRGERVYVVGNPAFEESSVVEGIVSNVNRTYEFSWTDQVKLPMIQFSGGIYGGNSGGALYNAKGELIGVPAAGHVGATFIGLAIPVFVVKEFMRDNCLASNIDASADDAACVAAKKKKDDKEDK